MLLSISKNIVDFLLQKEIISEEDREIYQFGVERLLTTVLNIATTLLLGIFFNKIYQSLLFVISFMILRSYAGGYHAEKSFNCYIFSVISILAALSMMSFFNFNYIICIGLLGISGLIIFLLSPVDTKNKPLDDIECIVYRKKSLIIWCIETFIALLALWFKFDDLTVCIALANILADIALILGKLQHEFHKTDY